MAKIGWGWFPGTLRSAPGPGGIVYRLTTENLRFVAPMPEQIGNPAMLFPEKLHCGVLAWEQQISRLRPLLTINYGSKATRSEAAIGSEGRYIPGGNYTAGWGVNSNSTPGPG